MVQYANIQTDNWYTQGFECARNGNVVSFAGGSIVLPNKTRTFAAFEFDIEGDAELVIVYDVYLLDNSTVDVMRTEIGYDSVAAYDGTEEVLHCLMTLRINPAQPLSSVPLLVRNAQRKEA